MISVLFCLHAVTAIPIMARNKIFIKTPTKYDFLTILLSCIFILSFYKHHIMVIHIAPASNKIYEMNYPAAELRCIKKHKDVIPVVLKPESNS